MIAGLILAAGEGSRFGDAKQLAELRGRPLIEHAIEAIAAVPAIDRIVVVLGAQAERIRAEARLEGTEIVVAEDWSEGISASIRAGVAALADADAIVITLADQPLITPQVIAAVIDRGEAEIPAVRATYEGRPGHPVLIKRELYADLGELEGDIGARELLELVDARTREVGHLARPDDVDTPEDLLSIERVVAADTEVRP